MIILQTLFIFLMASAFTPSAIASQQESADQQEAELGNVKYAGNGCPQESVAVVFSPDKKTVSLLFDSFVLEDQPGGERVKSRRKDIRKIGRHRGGILGNRGVERLNCKVLLPLKVPAGVQARVATIDMRGYVNLPEKSRATVFGRATFKNQDIKDPDSRERTLFIGPFDDTYVLQTKVPSEKDLDWTPCGSSANMIISTTLSMKNLNRAEPALITVDTADIVAEDTRLSVGLEWRACASPDKPDRVDGPGRDGKRCHPRDRRCQAREEMMNRRGRGGRR
jgi:Domain of unknown function (DUF4360)